MFGNNTCRFFRFVMIISFLAYDYNVRFECRCFLNRPSLLQSTASKCICIAYTTRKTLHCACTYNALKCGNFIRMHMVINHNGNLWDSLQSCWFYHIFDTEMYSFKTTMFDFHGQFYLCIYVTITSFRYPWVKVYC